jgi:integrase
LATIRLNEKTLAELRVPDDQIQVYYWDTELLGLGVVVGRNTKTFVARAWINGKNRRVKIGVAGRPRPDGHSWSVALARTEAKKLIGKMSDGLDVNAQVREERSATTVAVADGPTFRDAYETHLLKMRRRNRSEQTIATMKKEVEKYLSDWLDRPIAELTGAKLVKLHDQIKASARPREGTNPNNERGAPLANRVIAHVSACWNTLNKKLEGKLGAWNPAKSVEKNQLTAKRERITDADLHDWYARVQTMRNPIQRDGLLLALFTGLRSEDVRTIRFEHVDWSERSLVLPDPMGGADRAFKIPLSKTCMEILRRRRYENAESPLLPAGDAGHAFPAINSRGEVGPISDLRQQVHDGNKHSRFPAEDVHTLRRTYESVAHEIGISELDLHVLTNHAFASHNVNATYIAQALPHLAQCQTAIEAALWKRIRAQPKHARRKRATVRRSERSGVRRGTRG